MTCAHTLTSSLKITTTILVRANIFTLVLSKNRRAQNLDFKRAIFIPNVLF